MRPFNFIISLLICSSQLFSQEVRVYEDFYVSGKIYVRGYNIQIDSTSSAALGLWTYWYENGNKLSEEIRNDPHLTKYINCWTGNGQQICANGVGIFYETWTDIGFVDDSTVYTIKDSLKQGKFVCFVHYKKERIKRAEGNYVNGLRQGEVTFFYETGEPLIVQIYLDNKENGVRKLFYKNGKLKEQGIQKEGIQDSIWTFYDSLGNIEKKVTYERNRKKHIIEFHSNGQVKAEGDFVQIKATPKKKRINRIQTKKRTTRTSSSLTVKNGDWLYFDKAGKIIKKEKYSSGKLIPKGM
jgi:antitoxin component YwqK of YwqJK toxin-antitoxin module